MSDKTGIEWTDATWNPVTGCTKVSQGCKHCYAKHQAWPRLAASPNTVYTGRAFEDVRCHPERLDQPLRWTKPRRIFVNSMSDLFHESVPDEFIDQVFAVMALARQHTFQVLTKRPERMLAYLTGGEGIDVVSNRVRWEAVRLDNKRWCEKPSRHWPLSNVWLGVSVEDQATADERIPLLMQTPAAVRWISAEPLLGPVNIERYVLRFVRGQAVPVYLDWVVVGGESGPGARPMHPAWALALRDQCVAAGVPFLFKQWGEWRPIVYFDAKDKARAMPMLKLPGTKAEQRHEIVLGSMKPGDAPPINMKRVGKKVAGRELDGRTWDEYPA